MTELEKAIAIISAASGAEATDVAERLTSDAAATAVATELFEPKFRAQRDQGDQRATLKTRKEVEKALKAAGVEDASFADLSAALESIQTTAAASGGSSLTEEQVLKHPAVVKALNTEKQQRETLIEAARTEERGKLSEKEQAFTKAQVAAKVRQRATEIEAELQPNYTPGREAVQRKKFIDEIVAMGDYALSGDDFSIVDESGILKDGKMGNPLRFEDRVRDYADENYGLPVSQPRQSAGLTPEQIAAGKGAPVLQHYKGALPKTEDEYATAANDPNLTAAALTELRGYWKEQAGK